MRRAPSSQVFALVGLAVGLALVAGVPRAHAKTTVALFPGPYEVEESESFALKWEARLALEPADRATLLGAAETAFARYHAHAGFPVPADLLTDRMNVYVADEEGEPASDGFGGYLTFTDDGVAYLVIGHQLILDDDPGLGLVMAHEYFHAVQFGLDAYATSAQVGGVADWFLEATANWAVTLAFPDDDLVLYDIGPYLAGPEAPLFLTSWELPFTSPLSGHEYGALLFPLHVERHHGGLEVLVDAFTGAGPSDDPLDVLDGLTDADLPTLFADFAARNVGWDWAAPLGSALAAAADAVGPPASARYVDVAPAEGPVGPLAYEGPGSFGYQLVSLPAGPGERWVVVESEGVGTHSSPADVRATLVEVSRDLRSPLALGTATPLAADVDAVLVVSVTSPSRDVDERFGWRLTVTEEPPPADGPPAVDGGPTPESPGGEEDGGPARQDEDDPPGCSSTRTETHRAAAAPASTAPGSAAWLTVLLVARRRARRGRR